MLKPFEVDVGYVGEPELGCIGVLSVAAQNEEHAIDVIHNSKDAEALGKKLVGIKASEVPEPRIMKCTGEWEA